MKIHIITVGEPKLPYARSGWDEYIGRLKHYHSVRLTHIADRHNDSDHLLAAAGMAYTVALVIDAKQLSSPELAAFIEGRNQDGREVAFLIGGPTFPHDLAMVVLAETLYRSSTIAAGQPYHR
jgi:23S rRNA (pseudouridine1915-N3)-methyltransferase